MSDFDVILWDIDGTLLRGGGIGRAATRFALEEVFGTSAGLEHHHFGGKTDWYTLNELLLPQGFTLAEIEARLPAYAEAIAGEMARTITDFEVVRLPNALELVTALRQRGDVRQGIVTGNVYNSVSVKLKAAGFDPGWFTFGAYGHESANRNDLPPLAITRATNLVGRNIALERVLVVGDTVRDVEAARAAGAKVAIVETGYAERETLVAAEPDWLIPDLTHFAQVMVV
jgi:phosphoglycolate phosphatase